MLGSKTKVKVSIGIPVYNGEKYIKECISSLVKQNFKNFEIIISDNCSEDSTLKICKKFKKKYKKKIFIFRQKKKITSLQNMQYVLNKSHGEYFMWLAAHHKISRNFIKNNLNFLETNKKNYSASMSVDFFRNQSKKYFSFEQELYENLLKFYQFKWRTHSLYYSLVRKNIIKKSKEISKSYPANDWSVMIDLIFCGKIHRDKDSFLMLGKDGRSSGQRPFEHFKLSYFHKIFPYYTFYKYFIFKIIKTKKIIFFKKIILIIKYFPINFYFFKKILK